MTVDVGVIGATGLVGQEMLRILEERKFPVGTLRAYASPRSEGRALPFAGGEVVCEVLRDGCFDGLDLVIVDVDDPLALEWAPIAAAAGARVVDNSAAFRMRPPDIHATWQFCHGSGLPETNTCHRAPR